MVNVFPLSHFRNFRILLILFLFYSQVPRVSAIDQTFAYLSFQTGTQDLASSGGPLGSNSDYFSSIENDHGKADGDMKVRPEVYSFDFYRVSGSVASGFGIDAVRFNRSFSFADGSNVSVYGIGVLYGFNFYYRGDFWYPFFGFGTGNYTAKVQEKLYSASVFRTGTVFGQVETPLYYKFGLRIPFNSWGIIATQQYTTADMTVPTENKTLSLGGSTTLFGVYIGF